MKKHIFGTLILCLGMLLLSGCATPSAGLFDDEFDSLDARVWSSLPSLSPYPGFEGSGIPGEVKVEDGVLKLSRYAPEQLGSNPASFIQSIRPVHLPAEYTVSLRFKNEFAGLALGKLYIAAYKSTVWVGRTGVDDPLADSYQYHADPGQYFILTMHVTDSGYTLAIREDTANSSAETFSKTLDLSGLAGDSIIMIGGGSNTGASSYSEFDYIRIRDG